MSSIKTVTILGSTGSIGTNTLDLIALHSDAYKVVGLTANSNVKLLAEQAIKFKAEAVAIADESHYAALKDALSCTNVTVTAGEAAVADLASAPSDFVMSAIVGFAGLRPTLEAARRGAIIGLANKECLVCAGDLMTNEIKTHGATLLPVDSEHNAIFQVFDFERPEGVDKIILTASGGPFRSTPLEQLTSVTPAMAVAHPNWDMGAKISVDSATMMNKGLELIEAYHLFPVRADQIDVVVHPQSVIHSMVEYKDSSVLAQLGSPDMRTPIGYALAYPERINTPSERLNLAEIGKLTFEAPDYQRFPCLKVARDVMAHGGAQPTIMNAANEIAVAAFLAGQIRFVDISAHVVETLTNCDMKAPHSLANVYEIDAESRQIASKLLSRFQQ